MSGLDAESLRRMVREVLREVLPAEAARSPVADVRRVQVRDDDDLAALVGDVMHLVEDPDRAADLRAGRIRFVLDTGDAPAHHPPRTGAPLDVERGAVTERLVARAAQDGRSLRVGPRAVVTPLARDRARALGVSIETVSSPEGRTPR
jgi:hypothetical protein